jgi:cytochrome c oxidase assembly protein subunit 11
MSPAVCRGGSCRNRIRSRRGSARSSQSTTWPPIWPRETLGQAAYNVAPATTGIHFQKINCFCFTEQRLGPGEKREMPVVFYIDPALAQDAELADLNSITLSYSFYALREPARPVADRGAKAATN